MGNLLMAEVNEYNYQMNFEVRRKSTDLRVEILETKENFHYNANRMQSPSSMSCLVLTGGVGKDQAIPTINKLKLSNINLQKNPN